MSDLRIEPNALEVDVEIAARPDTVFGFFTDPERFAQWMGAAHGQATIDARVGGMLRVDFMGGQKVVEGEVLELDAPHRFAFTWGFTDGMPFPAGSTRVEVSLSPTPLGTRVTLRHSGLPSETAARDHAGGWRLYASVLAGAAAQAEFGAKIDDIARAWCDAWNESDGEKRDALLATCTTHDVEFRHAFAATRGRDTLAAHIVQSQRSMPGIRLAAGRTELCHRYLRFVWNAVAGENVVATGENFGVLAPDGRFELVAGFTDDS